jgi:Phage integrase, N-terminal SAM-like domain
VRFIHFHGLRHPNTMGAPEIERFLTDLASHGHAAASTQTQAFGALLFLYQQVLGIELPRPDALRARRRCCRRRQLPGRWPAFRATVTHPDRASTGRLTLSVASFENRLPGPWRRDGHPDTLRSLSLRQPLFKRNVATDNQPAGRSRRGVAWRSIRT